MVALPGLHRWALGGNWKLAAERVRDWAPVRENLGRGKEDFSLPHRLTYFDKDKKSLTWLMSHRAGCLNVRFRLHVSHPFKEETREYHRFHHR
jgi:hypothetical protein